MSKPQANHLKCPVYKYFTDNYTFHLFNDRT